MKSLDFDLIVELLRADGSIVVNKGLIQAIGLNEAVLYCELLSRYNYFKERDLLDEEGYFYNTQYDLQAGTGLGEKAQRTAIANLKRVGLIEVVIKGLPAKRYFKIIPNSELLGNLMKKGKEKAERLANSRDTSIGGNLKRQGKELVVAERSANNIHYNNTNLNNTKSYKVYNGDVKTSRSENFSFDILNTQIDKIFKEKYPENYIGNLTKEDIKKFFVMFYEIGSYRRGIKPTRLKTEQVENIIDSIYIINDEFEPSLEDYKLIIEDYFRQDFPNCDYGINHFISGDVLLMRYYNLQQLLE